MAFNSDLAVPKIQGNIIEAPRYSPLGVGTTRPVLLIGHADTEDDIYHDFHKVVNIQETVNYLQGDIASPLVRGLLETYNAGCRDIWVYVVAPMDEYVDNLESRFDAVVEWDNQNFYEKYYDQLATAYSYLIDHDFYEFIVPLEAPYHDAGSVDFATQLASFCQSMFAATGSVSLGVLGTRAVAYDADFVNELANDSRSTSYTDNGKFISVVVGEGVYRHTQTTSTYNRSFEATVAALYSTADLDRSLSGHIIPNVLSVSFRRFTDDELTALCQAKLNPVRKTHRGNRGESYQVQLVTDNTMGQTGSDFWGMSQMRLVAQVINRVRDIGLGFIGSSNAEDFKSAVTQYLLNLRSDSYIKDFSLHFEEPTDFDSLKHHKIIVSIGISPQIGIKNIFFSVLAGPGE